MSVLIEALTMVVRNSDLDMRYPGGSRAFLEAALELERPPRFMCDLDDDLVNLGFFGADDVLPAFHLLLEQGFADEEEGRVAAVAFVDQHFGPTLPCDWLQWQHHPDGFAYAWLTGTEPGDPAAYEGWTPAVSRALRRHDIRDEPGRMLQLAAEDGLETWLDLQTGEQVRGLAHRDMEEPEGMADGVHELEPPLPNCYRVPRLRAFAGEHPYHEDELPGPFRLKTLLDAGVTCFIDLTESGEAPGYERDLRREARSRIAWVVRAARAW